MELMGEDEEGGEGGFIVSRGKGEMRGVCKEEYV